MAYLANTKASPLCSLHIEIRFSSSLLACQLPQRYLIAIVFLSKVDTFGTDIFVRSRQVSALDRLCL